MSLATLYEDMLNGDDSKLKPNIESKQTNPDDELLKTIHQINNTDLLGKKAIDVLIECENNILKKQILETENEQWKTIIVLLLKALIGQTIYWAHPGWKIEEHTITDVNYKIYNSDFFDTEEKTFKNKKCIVIQIDGAGDYLADFIGKNLFFTKEEAINRANETIKR